MKMRTWVSAIVLTAAVATGGYMWSCRESAAKEQDAAAAAPAAPQAVPVSVIEVKAGRIPFSLQLPGRVSPFKVAEIRPQVNGIVTKRLFEEGSDVKQGQQLYQIDDALYRAAYDRANADLLKAQANLKAVEARAARYAELVKLNAVSKQEFDDADASRAQGVADVAVARAALASAKIELEYTKVLSPISGRIGKSMVTEGALVTANQASVLSTVQQLDPVYVDFTQSSTELIKLRRRFMSDAKAKMPTLRLTVEGEADMYVHEGEMQFSDVTVDQTTGAVQLRAVFPNPEGILLPGLFVRALITGETSEAGTLIPQQAVQRRPDGGAYIWVVGADEAVSQKDISLLRAVGDQWLLNAPLEDGTLVVVEGLQKIRPGAKVKPNVTSAPAGGSDVQMNGQPVPTASQAADTPIAPENSDAPKQD